MNIENFIGEKKNVLDSFYSESKQEILGFDDYLKLETTDAYKNNKQRIERVQKEKELGWTIYDEALVDFAKQNPQRDHNRT
jgi:uncharacterized protein YvpB